MLLWGTLGALGVAGAAYYLSTKKGQSSASAQNALNAAPEDIAKLAARFAEPGPGDVQVFKPDMVESLMRQLASQKFSYPETDDKRFIEMFPETSGAPVPLDLSALGWTQYMNTTQTILAPLYLGQPTRSRRFLRAVDSGSEAALAGKGGNYAVLQWAGNVVKKLPGAGAPGQPKGPIPSEPKHEALSEMHPELRETFQNLLNAANPDPAKLDEVASMLDQYGMPGSDLLRKKAAELRLQGALPGPQALPPALSPALVAQDVKWLQASLNTLGYGPLKEDGKPGPKTKAALSKFQVDKGLSPSGEADPFTRAAITAALLTVPSAPPAPIAMPQGKADPVWIQSSLNTLGFGPLQVDGVLGAQSKAAIVRFQRSKGLSPDGVVGPQTQAAMVAALGAMVVMPVAPPTDGAPMGQAIAVNLLTTAGVQKALNLLGASPSLKEDGKPGPATSSAVKAFQSKANLPPDGKVGPKTRSALRRALSALPLQLTVTGKR